MELHPDSNDLDVLKDELLEEEDLVKLREEDTTMEAAIDVSRGHQDTTEVASQASNYATSTYQ